MPKATTGAMSFFQLAALFVSLVAVGGWVNARTLRLPHAVAMLFVGMAGALALGGCSGCRRAWPAPPRLPRPSRASTSPQTVLGYLLGFLLFAGAMQVDLRELRRRRLSVWTLATLGVVASTAIVGAGVWLAAGWLGLACRCPGRWCSAR